MFTDQTVSMYPCETTLAAGVLPFDVLEELLELDELLELLQLLELLEFPS